MTDLECSRRGAPEGESDLEAEAGVECSPLKERNEGSRIGQGKKQSKDGVSVEGQLKSDPTESWMSPSNVIHFLYRQLTSNTHVRRKTTATSVHKQIADPYN